MILKSIDLVKKVWFPILESIVLLWRYNTSMVTSSMKPTFTRWEGLSNYEVSPQCINKKSSSERCCYVQSEQTHHPYGNAKDLTQSWRIYIRVASLSLVSFRHLSVLLRGWLITYMNIYHLFADANISYCFLSSM